MKRGGDEAWSAINEPISGAGQKLDQALLVRRLDREHIDQNDRVAYGKMPRFVIALATRSTATMNAASRNGES